MSFPTPGAYQEALQFPETAFLDPELRRGKPLVNALGLPQPITGAFAAVFPVDTPAGRYAVRCFLTDVPDQQARYAAVARHLDRSPVASMVDYVYLPEGIRVEGRVYPILKMAWVEGVPLNRYVERLLGRPERLLALARAWTDLTRALAEAGIAHGDLQHGNILVEDAPDEESGDDRSFRFRLVDYDTLYVPSLAGRESPELGHRNYQHPDRSKGDFGPTLDHFSGLAILTALLACAEEPELWNAHDTGENLLFQAGDFYHPDASELFGRLYALPDVAPFARALRTACYLDPMAAPAPHEVEPEGVISGNGSVGVGAARPPGGHRPGRQRQGIATGRQRPEGRFWGWLSTAGVGLASLLAGEAWVGLGILAALAAALMGLAWRRFLMSEARLRRKRLDRERAYIDRRIADLRADRDRIRQERAALRENRDALLDERLRVLRDDRLREGLKVHFIGELEGVEGVPHKAVIRLKQFGIRTAYHLTPDRLRAVTGIDPEVRSRIAVWRAALLRKYEPGLPDRLPASEVQRLDRHLERRTKEFDAEEARLQARLDVQADERLHVEERIEETPPALFVEALGGVLGLRAGRTVDDREDTPRAYVRRAEESREAAGTVEP